MLEQELQQYLLRKYPQENARCEWKEFKNLKNSFCGDEKDDVISYVSAIANMEGGHLVIGVKDKTLEIVGTDISRLTFNGQPANTQSATFKLTEQCTYLSSEGLSIEEFVTDDTNKRVWKNFQDYKYTLGETFLSTLVSIEETKNAERAAKRAHKFDAAIDASVEFFNLGANYWMKVYNDLMKENVLSYGDCSFIKGIADYIAKQNLPSASQCKRLAKIVNKAEDKGYIMPN